MKLSLFTAALGLTITGVLSVPATVSAQTDRPNDQRVQRDVVTDSTPRPAHEELRLHCVGRLADSGRAGVACEWSQTQRRDAAGYVLVRADGDNRTVVFETRNLRETNVIDSEIRVGVRYQYSVLVKDASGRTIGSGGPVTAGVEKPDSELEVLKMECGQRAADVFAVVCKWRPATSDAAVGYQLWRIVDRGEREFFWRGGLDVTSNVSRVPQDAEVVRYVVLAVDARGNTVGQSRPQTVKVKDKGPDVDVSRIGRAVPAANAGFRTFI